MYAVHRTCAETAAVSCGSSHASAVRWIFKKRTLKKCERSESAQESGRIALYKRSSIKIHLDVHSRLPYNEATRSSQTVQGTKECPLRSCRCWPTSGSDCGVLRATLEVVVCCHWSQANGTVLWPSVSAVLHSGDPNGSVHCRT